MFPGYFADDILKVVFEQNNFISVQISTALVCSSLGPMDNTSALVRWQAVIWSSVDHLLWFKQSFYEYEININLYIFVSTV